VLQLPEVGSCKQGLGIAAEQLREATFPSLNKAVAAKSEKKWRVDVFVYTRGTHKIGADVNCEWTWNRERFQDDPGKV
jgi:hypothetical protein